MQEHLFSLTIVLGHIHQTELVINSGVSQQEKHRMSSMFCSVTVLVYLLSGSLSQDAVTQHPPGDIYLCGVDKARGDRSSMDVDKTCRC